LLVVLDTVRADALGSYGNSYPTSPQFDAIAEAGGLFEDITAPGSWTWPSHASLFTGLAPWEHGAHAASVDTGVSLKGEQLRVTPMREDVPTLAEQFGQTGYGTHAVAVNRLLGQPLGLTRGFDSVQIKSDDPGAVDLAIARMGGEEPLFLFINLMTAHSPYHQTPATWAARHSLSEHTWTAPYLVEPDGFSFYATEDSKKEAPTQSIAHAQTVSGGSRAQPWKVG
jgi:hypothetical protein